MGGEPLIAVAGAGDAAAAAALLAPPPGDMGMEGELLDLGPPTYGEALAPPPLAHHRKKKEIDPSRNIGGRRVGGQPTTDAPPALDLPPHEAQEIDRFFTGGDDDDFLNFLEGGMDDDLEGGLGILENDLPG